MKGTPVGLHRSSPSVLDAYFAALSDPIRRDIIRTLLHEPRRAGELAVCVAMSPQALSRHLRVLRKTGLVVEQGLKEDARVRIYSVSALGLEPVQEWLWRIEELCQRQLHTHRPRRLR